MVSAAETAAGPGTVLFRLLARKRADLPATVVFASRDPAAGEGEDGYGRRIASVDAILAEGIRIYVRLTPANQPAPRLHRADEHSFILEVADADPQSKAVLMAILGRDVTVYLHSILPLAESVVREAVRSHTGEVILDMHGGVPEERALGGHGDAGLFAALEREFYKTAGHVICVSQRMADHLRGKHGAAKNSPIIMPILASGPAENRQPDSYGERPRVIYAGGAQIWQRLPEMLDLIAATRQKYDFVIHTHAVAEFLAGLASRGVAAPCPGITVAPASNAAVLEACRQSDFGLLLRDVSVVNEIACPTKLVEYMKCGAIPVLDAVSIGDFADLGLAFVRRVDLESGSIPSRDQLAAMARANRSILAVMAEHSHLSAATLRDILYWGSR